jgi:exopolysaccharide production protein ExoQ
MLDQGRAGLSIPTMRGAALRRLLRPAERVWLVVLLSTISGAYLPLIARRLGGEAVDANATPLAHVVLLPLYVVLGLLIITCPKAFARAAWRGKFALALVGLAGFSTLWSAQPGLTLSRSISLLAPTALGVFIALRFSSTELVRLLAFALGIPAVLSAIVALVLPADGVSTIEYGSAWHGVYGNKNDFGRAMALGAAVFVLVALDGKRYRRVAWLGLAGSLGLVVLARAAASLVVSAALLSLIPLFRSLRLRFTTTVGVWTVSILLLAILVTLLASNAEPVFAVLGRDTTLTGRTQIWAAVLASIFDRPWLGYGYNAFWQDWNGPSAAVLSSVGWETPNSHNGFLELWLDLGLAGLVTFMLGLGSAVRAGVARARHSDAIADLWPLVFLTFLVLINFSEAAILTQHSLFWVLYVAILSSDRHTRLGKPESGMTMPEAWEPASMSPEVEWSPGGLDRPGTVSPGVRRAYRARGRNG